MRRLPPAPVLRDAHSGARGHERRCGGDVEGSQAVATGADDVHERFVAGDGHRSAESPHGARDAVDLVGGLALGAEPHEESGGLYVAHLSLDYELEHARGQIGVEVALFGQLIEDPRHQRYGDRVQRPRAAHQKVVEEIDQLRVVGYGLFYLVAAVFLEVLGRYAEALRHGLDGLSLESALAGYLLAQGLVFPAFDPAEELPKVDARMRVSRSSCRSNSAKASAKRRLV